MEAFGIIQVIILIDLVLMFTVVLMINMVYINLGKIMMRKVVIIIMIMRKI